MNNYVFMPSFSLTPNKLVSFNSIFIRDNQSNNLKSLAETRVKKRNSIGSVEAGPQLQRKFHNFQISDNAYRNLKQKINWLYYLAKSKSVTTYSGKSIYNFKIGFLTLTLPSEQRHNTNELHTILLNPFLTEIRQRTGMRNYVWRLEYQKNGNAHWHLVTDTYLDYFFALKIWNRLLKKHGYIQPYKEKHEKISLLKYNQMYNSEGKTEFKKMAYRYAKGKANKWEQPNTIDLKSVLSKKAIANYISKYFGKEPTGEQIKNKLDNEENCENLRLWFCSRSLSKLKRVTDFCEAVEYDIFSIVSHATEKKKKFYKYATVWYFEIKSLLGNARQWIEKILRGYASELGYIPSG